MKKLSVFTFLLLLSLLIVSPALAVPADSPDNIAHLCKSLQEDYPSWFSEKYSSHGDCVSSHRLAHIEFCREMYDDPEYDFRNLGQCISYLRDYYRK